MANKVSKNSNWWICTFSNEIFNVTIIFFKRKTIGGHRQNHEIVSFYLQNLT